MNEEERYPGEIKTEKAEMYTWTCPFCGKKYRSLYKDQLQGWIESHMMKHRAGEIAGGPSE